MAINDRYLCFSEVRQSSLAFGTLLEMDILDKDEGKNGCVNLTLLEGAAKSQEIFMSLDGLPKNLTGKNGFIKFSSKARPKIEIEVSDRAFSLDLFSMVDFINTFQDPNKRSIRSVLAVFRDQEEIVKAFNEALEHLNLGLILKSKRQINQLFSLVCTDEDKKLVVNLPAQLRLLETPVFEIPKKTKNMKIEVLKANSQINSDDETDSLTNSGEGV